MTTFWLKIPGGVKAIAAIALAGAANIAANATAEPQSDGLAVASSRCSRLADVVSCAAALSMKPNDPDLLVAEADALLHVERPGEAIGVYRNSIRAGSKRDAVNRKIAAAETRRGYFLVLCETGVGEAAERACEAAWLPGAPDELTVFKRRGLLLQNDKNASSALQAYLAAARLAPRDRDVARAIIGLTGGTDQQDAAILAARGSAQITLGRPLDAIRSLRQALRLMPDLPGGRARLRMAERLLHEANAPPATPIAPADGGLASATNKYYSNDAPASRSN